MNSNNESQKEQESLEQLLNRLQIQPNEWDLLLVGDGSGSKWGYPIGWGCVAVYPNRLDRKVYWGCASSGTVNIAESLAYLIPLTEFAKDTHDQAKVNKRNEPKNVHIVTDSEYARRRGEGSGSIDFKKNSAIWAGLEMFNRQGIFLHWHHKPREDVALNRYADAVSKEARRQAKNKKMLTDLFDKQKMLVAEHNPRN